MVLLKRIYSETGLFNEVRFHKGINIILGKYSKDKEQREVNGIGKSTLIRLISFAFLSKKAKKVFFSDKYDFLRQHNFTLEFSVDGTSYLIKRYFENSKKDIVYFGEKNSKLVEYSETEMKEILENKFFLNDYNFTVHGTWFASLMKFFIKDDMDHHRRIDPINFVHGSVRKSILLCYNFYLLGLPTEHLCEFDALRDKSRKLRNIKKDIEKKLKEETGKSVEELRTEITKVEQQITELEDSLKEYKFLKNYKDVEDKLVEISKEISKKLGEIHVLNKKLEAYRESYEIKIEIDIQRVTEIYREVNKKLGDFVENTLQEVIDFRKKIAEGRKRFLQKREKELNQAIQKLTEEISLLEARRSKLYGFLNEKKALDSIKNTYQLLIDKKAELEKVRISIERLQELEKEIAEINSKISNIVKSIINVIDKEIKKIEEIKKLFYDIVEYAIFVDEYSSEHKMVFDIKATSSQRNPVDIIVSIPREESLGKSRFKILAYDLTVFFNIVYNNRPIPHFLVHDGVFHGIDKRTVINVLNYINSRYLQDKNSNFQYIITINEDELYVPSDKKALYGSYDFDIGKHIIAKYEDTPSKMIFGREF